MYKCDNAKLKWFTHDKYYTYISIHFIPDDLFNAGASIQLCEINLTVALFISFLMKKVHAHQYYVLGQRSNYTTRDVQQKILNEFNKK